VATLTRYIDFDFNAASQSDWSAFDSGAFAGDLATIDDPVVECPFTRRRWSPIPPTNDGGDAQLADATRYHLLADDDSSAYVADGEVGLHLKRTVEAPGFIDMWCRYDPLTEVGVRVRLSWPTATTLRVNVYDHTGAPFGQIDRTGVDDIPVDTWTLVRLKTYGERLYIKIGERNEATLDHSISGVTHTTAGTWAFEVDSSEDAFLISDGFEADGTTPDDTEQPYYAERLTGGMTRNEDDYWTAPANIAALTALDPHYDYTYDADGDNETQRTMRYKLIDADGDWDDVEWVVVAAGEDLSGVSVSAGDLIRVQMDYSNHTDHTARPAYSRMRLGYTVTVPDWTEDIEMIEVLKNLKAAIEADATVTGWAGFDKVMTLWEGFGFIDIGKCGVVLIPVESPEAGQGRRSVAVVDGVQKAVTWYEHEVDVWAGMRCDTDMESIITDDDSLLDFAEAVKQCIRQSTLGGTVHEVRITNATYSSLGNLTDDGIDAILGVAIRVAVTSATYEAPSS